MTARFYHVGSATFPGAAPRKGRAMRRMVIAGSLVVLSVMAGCRRQSNRALDPANELPFGTVDTPANGQHVGGEVNFGGWAMDDRGIREIRIYVDGHFVNLGQLGVERADVSKAFPQYVHGNHQHGWGIPIDFTSPGAHKVVVQAVDIDGATRDIGVLDITSGG